jgi:alcohol oxidase
MAKKLVVVSAGCLGTPQILERSGVGNPEILKKAGITPVADVPGVGENYQDHHLVLYPYKSSLAPEETLDGILSGRKDFVKSLEAKDPMLGWNGIDISAKLRMPESAVKALGPDFEEAYKRDFAPYPTKPVMLCGVVNAFLADPSLVEPGQYITMGTYTAYPYSRGSIHITNKEDLIEGYDFDAGFMNDEKDVKKQLWAYKMSREVARRLPYYKGELELGHPKFREGSKAALSTAGEAVTADIEYDEEDDKVIEDWIRGNVNTTWHSLGTCAMRPLKEGGVLDKDLNVYNTQSLKVADLSACPENVGANTNNTALVLGEKAAIIIGRELGIEV